MSRRVLALVVLSTSLAAAVHAGPRTADEAKARIRELDRAMSAANRRLTGELGKLEEADRRLADLDRDLEAAVEEGTRLARELTGRRERLDEIRATVAERDRALRRRAGVLWRLHRGGWLRMLFDTAAGAGTLDAVPRRLAAVQLILESDRRWIDERRALVEAQAEATAALEQAARANDIHKERLTVLRRRAVEERREREQLVARLRRDRARYATELDKARADLGRVLEALARAKARARTGNIERLRGYFSRPVPGAVLEGFGRDESGKFARNGVVFAVSPGEPVLAAQDGTVLYSGWFKGYGQMLVLDHGSGLLSVYAHLQRLLRRAGEQVLKDDPIAQAGETGSPSGPRLYFEIRHRGRALDPMRWIGAG